MARKRRKLVEGFVSTVEPLAPAQKPEESETDDELVYPDFDVPVDVTFVLEGCSLRPIKRQSGRVNLMTIDRFETLAAKKNLGPLRPELTHQALLAIVDSPLCKAGAVKRIVLATDDGKVVLVDPAYRVPRTFVKFASVMAHVMITSEAIDTDDGEPLVQVVRPPADDYIPQPAVMLSLSRRGSLARLRHVLGDLPSVPTATPSCRDLVCFIGASPDASTLHSDILGGRRSAVVSVSQFPLSASTAVSRVTSEVEAAYSIF